MAIKYGGAEFELCRRVLNCISECNRPSRPDQDLPWIVREGIHNELAPAMAAAGGITRAVAEARIDDVLRRMERAGLLVQDSNSFELTTEGEAAHNDLQRLPETKSAGPVSTLLQPIVRKWEAALNHGQTEEKRPVILVIDDELAGIDRKKAKVIKAMTAVATALGFDAKKMLESVRFFKDANVFDYIAAHDPQPLKERFESGQSLMDEACFTEAFALLQARQQESIGLAFIDDVLGQSGRCGKKIVHSLNETAHKRGEPAPDMVWISSNTDLAQELSADFPHLLRPASAKREFDDICNLTPEQIQQLAASDAPQGQVIRSLAKAFNAIAAYEAKNGPDNSASVPMLPRAVEKPRSPKHHATRPAAGQEGLGA